MTDQNPEVPATLETPKTRKVRSDKGVKRGPYKKRIPTVEATPIPAEGEKSE